MSRDGNLHEMEECCSGEVEHAWMSYWLVVHIDEVVKQQDHCVLCKTWPTVPFHAFVGGFPS